MTPPVNPTRERILFVDEHEDTCEAMTVLLSHRGYEVVTASTLITTLLTARGQPFNLYVLDAEFWGDGAELCRSIREFDPLTPIIFFSTAPDESARREAFEAGATDYVIKPDVDGLIESVSYCTSAKVCARESLY
ncbi:MAG TPA: response regulator [Pyrinomonadaceae bacterium]